MAGVGGSGAWPESVVVGVLYGEVPAHILVHTSATVYQNMIYYNNINHDMKESSRQIFIYVV